MDLSNLDEGGQIEDRRWLRFRPTPLSDNPRLDYLKAIRDAVSSSDWRSFQRTLGPNSWPVEPLPPGTRAPLPKANFMDGTLASYLGAARPYVSGLLSKANPFAAMGGLGPMVPQSGAEPSAVWGPPSSAAEPSAVWGGPAPAVPMPQPRPAGPMSLAPPNPGGDNGGGFYGGSPETNPNLRPIDQPTMFQRMGGPIGGFLDRYSQYGMSNPDAGLVPKFLGLLRGV